ncbi:MarR family transcriptional regulator [Alicyclobacillus fastidiosus]|uniref:MarR family transcriptional regulator n=1 Tax=Alicyclobacillus fastidiosus TaxID=392011 RepID=A0ABY6ZLX7_9BACL|nr:MarR family transcriptional regulator [Alicyclobacillus fastidiosus]WAH43920.1 MarR family transcriptional regulator [Alicyclobacillus fastidiosus]GMA60163.1 hypothetical protein GCM10025859_06030 [Alicyclobacillus fastidiosus]
MEKSDSSLDDLVALQVLERIQTIHRQLRSHVVRHDDHTLTRLQWMILRHIGRTSPCSVGDLATHFDVKPSTVSQMLDRLERYGYVVRRPGVNDARVRIVELTAVGRSLIDNVKSASLERIKSALATMDATQAQALLPLLDALARALGNPV